MKSLKFTVRLSGSRSDDVSSVHNNQERVVPGYVPGSNLSHFSDEYYPPSGDPNDPDHYIYVSYPPDMKRRLLDR